MVHLKYVQVIASQWHHLKLFKKRKIRGKKNEGGWRTCHKELEEVLKWRPKFPQVYGEEERDSFSNWRDQERVFGAGA